MRLRALTPIQRERLYKEAKELIYKRDKRFISTAIRSILIRRYGCHITSDNIPLYFPELDRRLPIGNTSRILILTECEKEAELAMY